MRASACRQGLLSLLAGAATAAAFAPYDVAVIPFITLAVLFRLWRAGDRKQAFVNGYLFGLGLFGVGVSWLHVSINLFSGINLAGAYLLTFLLVAYLALFPALAGLLGRWRPVRSEPYFFLALMPSLWVLGEWARAGLFTGFPWLTLGYTQTDSWLAGYAGVAGVFGVSFFCALLAGALALLAGRNRKLLPVLTLLAVVVAGWQLRTWQWTDKTGAEIEVALIQGALPQELKWLPEYRNLSLKLYPELTEPFWGHDLIIWPETAIPGYLHQFEDYIDNLERTARDSNSILLVGIPSKNTASGAQFNSLALLGDRRQIYHKRHLVPFGEYLPLRSALERPLRRLDIPIANFTPGVAQEPALFQAKGFAMGVSICYEAVFGAEVMTSLPQAQVLVNVSNDAWFGDSASPHQHLQMARMRAIETGRYLLRATNTGISAIIDEKGNIVGKTRQFEPDAVATRVPLFTGHTPYSLSGDKPIMLLSLALLLWALLFSARAPRD